MPHLPVEVWGHIMDILEAQRRDAATTIQACFKGFKVRIGPLRYIIRYIRKGNLVQATQGQTMDWVLVDGTIPAFEHGHSYVAASRVHERSSFGAFVTC
jgi:hypothetical protein